MNSNRGRNFSNIQNNKKVRMLHFFNRTTLVLFFIAEKRVKSATATTKEKKAAPGGKLERGKVSIYHSVDLNEDSPLHERLSESTRSY